METSAGCSSHRVSVGERKLKPRDKRRCSAAFFKKTGSLAPVFILYERSFVLYFCMGRISAQTATFLAYLPICVFSLRATCAVCSHPALLDVLGALFKIISNRIKINRIKHLIFFICPSCAAGSLPASFCVLALTCASPRVLCACYLVYLVVPDFRRDICGGGVGNVAAAGHSLRRWRDRFAPWDAVAVEISLVHRSFCSG